MATKPRLSAILFLIVNCELPLPCKFLDANRITIEKKNNHKKKINKWSVIVSIILQLNITKVYCEHGYMYFVSKASL